MYADVVVLTYQPPDIDFYTYQVPKNLESQIKIGQLVSVPFGKRNPLGITVHLRGEVKATPGPHLEGVTFKEIQSIVFPKPILLPYQIQLLKWLSSYYHAPMVNCLKAMMPRLSALPHLRGEVKPTPSKHLEGVTARTQTLVLVPTINRLPEVMAAYSSAKNHVVYHNELKISEKFTAWMKILSGHADYIFGSRSASFVPCPNFAKITIYNEHDQAYKDERSPYYDTLTVAEKICQLTGAKLEIIDSLPRITTYYNHKGEIGQSGWQQWKGYRQRGSGSFVNNVTNINNSYSTKELGSTGGKETADRTHFAPNIKLISMLDEKRAGNKSPISDLLADYLRYAQKNHKGVLLFLNKKSQSGSLYCRACQYHEYCPKQPEVCPNCQSPNLWFNSLNVTSLASLVKQIVPNIQINVITEGLSPIPDTKYQIPNTIHIATAAVFYLLTRHQYDLVASIATDSLLSIPDFTSAERLYRQISELKNLARGMLVLQTYNPDHPVIQAAATANWQQFFNQELRERQTLKYPPFAILVKLTLRDKNETTLSQKAERLFDHLKSLDSSLITHSPRFASEAGHSSLTILGPYRSILGKTPRYNIILKVPIADYSLATREKALKNLEPLLEKVPREWQVVVEPGSLN